MRCGGIGCETDLVGRSFRAQMKYANKAGIPFVAVIGPDEVAGGTFSLKRMSDGAIAQFSIDDGIADIKKHITDNI